MSIDDKVWDSVDIMKERITRLEEQMKTVYNKTQEVSDKVDELLKQSQRQRVNVAQNQVQISNGERAFWLGTSAIVGLVLYWVKGG